MVESEDFIDHFPGYTIYDCVVQDHRNFFFVAVGDEADCDEQSDFADKRLIKIELREDARSGTRLTSHQGTGLAPFVVREMTQSTSVIRSALFTMAEKITGRKFTHRAHLPPSMTSSGSKTKSGPHTTMAFKR